MGGGFPEIVKKYGGWVGGVVFLIWSRKRGERGGGGEVLS